LLSLSPQTEPGALGLVNDKVDSVLMLLLDWVLLLPPLPTSGDCAPEPASDGGAEDMLEGG